MLGDLTWLVSWIGTYAHSQYMQFMPIWAIQTAYYYNVNKCLDMSRYICISRECLDVSTQSLDMSMYL